MKKVATLLVAGSAIAMAAPAAAQDEAGQKLVEDDPVWDARAVAPQRVVDVAFG